MKFLKLLIVLIFVSCSNNQTIQSQDSIQSQDNKFEIVQFTTEDGGSIEASLFLAKTKRIVIFAHGAVFNKESWYFLAEKFQKENIAGLSLDFRGYGNSKSGSTSNKSLDILAAINYAKNKGYTDINIIGGSMGGAAVLSALNENKIPVSKVILMAPAGGPPVQSKETDKLFIVSKSEGLYQSVLTLYNNSAKPKELAEYSGSTHAQHLFKSDHAKDVENLILEFIAKN